MAIPQGGAASTHPAKVEAGATIPTKSRIKKQQAPLNFPAQTISPPVEPRRQSFPLRNSLAGPTKPTMETATKSRIGNPSKQRVSNTTGTTIERTRRVSRVELPAKVKISETATKSYKSSAQPTSRLSITKSATNPGGPLVPISTPRRRSSINPHPAPHELKHKRSSIQLAPRTTPQQSSSTASTRTSSIATRIPPTSRTTRRTSELASESNTSVSGIPSRQRKISSIPALSSIRVGTVRRVSTSAAQTLEKAGRVGGGEGRKLTHAKSEANIRIGRLVKHSPVPALPPSHSTHLSPPTHELSPPISSQTSNLGNSINSTRSWETLPAESTRVSLSLAQRFPMETTGDSSEEVGNATMLEYDRSWETDEASRRASLLPPSTRHSIASAHEPSLDSISPDQEDVSTPIQSSSSPLGISQRSRLRNPSHVDSPLASTTGSFPLDQTPITKSLRQSNLNSASPLDTHSMALLMKGSTASDDILKMSLRSARNVSKDWFGAEGALHGIGTPSRNATTDKLEMENELLASLMRELEGAERRVFELEEANREKGEEMEEVVAQTRRDADRREREVVAKEREVETRMKELELLVRQSESRRLRTVSHGATKQHEQVSMTLRTALSETKESLQLSAVYNHFLAASAKSERAVLKSQLEALEVLSDSLELCE